MATGPMKTVLRHVDRLFSDGNVAALTDDVLLDRFLIDRDHEAFAAVVARHGPQVLGTCRSILGDSAAADDAFQEVFLTLSRRARTIQGRRSVEGWLHRVAHRVSCRALSESIRRIDRERRSHRSEMVVANDLAVTNEVHQAVHAELDRLPERYRKPVVLCLMEGRPQPEVAVALQVSEGAIRGRLARARVLLRSRLTRRGLAPAIGSVALGSLDAAVSERLLQTTLAAVSRQAAVAATTSFPLKIAAAALITALSLTAASFATATSPPTLPPPNAALFVGKPAPEIQKASEKPKPDGPKIVFRGRVLDAKNQPVAGAHFYLVSDAWASAVVQPIRSEVDGSYRLELPESTFYKNFNGGFSSPQVQTSLSVAADGFGVDWFNIEPGTKDGKAFIQPEYVNDFRVPLDREINGKIVDLKGKPIKDVIVVANHVYAPTDEKLEPILEELRQGKTNVLYSSWSHHGPWRWSINRMGPPVVHATMTDADGRFHIRGAGDSRLVHLNATGPGMVPTDFTVLNMDGVDTLTRNLRERYPHISHANGVDSTPKGLPNNAQAELRIFGPTPTVEVDPARTVYGTVRDASTGTPIPNARFWTVSDNAFGGSGAMTDAQGHYRGIRGDWASSITAFVSFDRSGIYLSAGYKLQNVGALGEVVTDFALKRGVVVTGKVFEAGTKKPIVSNPRDECGTPGALQAGFVHYRPLSTNKALLGTPEALYLESYEMPYGRESIGGDGSFKITVPPGPGVLLIEAYPGLPMMAGWGGPWSEKEGLFKLFPYAKLKHRFPNDSAPPSPEGNLASLPGLSKPISLTPHHTYQVINPAADATSLNVELEIPRAPSRLVKFVDPDGKPVKGLSVLGLLPPPYDATVQLDSSESDLMAIDAARDLKAVTTDGKLFASETISPGQGPVSIRMQPAPSVSGRAVDAITGKPLVDHFVGLTYFDLVENEAGDSYTLNQKMPRTRTQVYTDAEGNFLLNGVMPDRHFKIEFTEIRRPPKIPNGMELNYHPEQFKDMILKPGETRAVGRVPMSPWKR